MSKRTLYSIIICLLIVLGGILGTIIPSPWQYLFGLTIGLLVGMFMHFIEIDKI